MTFIATYWVEIILSAVSIVIGAGAGYVFYRLQKRDVASAKIERLKRAREEMLDILEGNIVNKQKTSEESIYNLLAASDRQHQVSLRDTCTPVTLLQDVALRLQRSRHLDIAQKTEYATQIDQTISVITESNREISGEARRPLELAKAAEEAIKNNQSEKALETIDLLKRELAEPTVLARAGDTFREERWQLLASLIAAMGTMIAVFATIADFSGLMRDVGIELIATLTVTLVLVMSAVVFRKLARQRQSREDREKGL